MQNWKITLNYSEKGINYEQTFTAPFLPRNNDIIAATFKEVNGNYTDDIVYKVDYISYSNLTFSIRINLKKI